MSIIKSELRKKIIEEIALLPGSYISASNDEISKRVTSLDEFINARNIMVYYSVKREPDTLRIVNTAMSMGKTIAFPLCYSGGIMQARVVKSLGDLRSALLGIPAPPFSAPLIAPEDLELIIVPALTYDKSGYRLGYGGGYYDRYLSALPVFTVGLAREWLIKEELPAEPYDIAVKCLVTECKTRNFLYSGGELIDQRA